MARISRRHQADEGRPVARALTQLCARDGGCGPTRAIAGCRVFQRGDLEFLLGPDATSSVHRAERTRASVEHPDHGWVHGSSRRAHSMFAGAEPLALTPSTASRARHRVRLNAEDPERDFMPAPEWSRGSVRRSARRAPSTAASRTGMRVSRFYDSLLARSWCGTPPGRLHSGGPRRAREDTGSMGALERGASRRSILRSPSFSRVAE